MGARACTADNPGKAEIALLKNEVVRNQQEITRLQGEIEQRRRQIDDLQRNQNPFSRIQNAQRIAALNMEISSLQTQLVPVQQLFSTIQQRLAIAQQGPAAAVVTGPVQLWTGQTISASVRLQGRWVRDLALTAANRVKQQADEAAAAIKPAQDKIAAAQRVVADFDRRIEKRKAEVQRAFDDATASIRDAENKVKSKQAEVNRLQGEIDWRKREIDSLDNSDWDRFKNAARITQLGIEIAGLKMAWGTASGALKLAQEALQDVRNTVKATPPELDPELTGLKTAREATNTELIAAQGTLKAAQQALGALGSVPGYLAGASLDTLVVIDQASFSGTLDVMQGGSVTMSMTVRMMGAAPQTYSISFNFRSPMDAAQELATKLVPDAARAISRARQIISTMSTIPNL